MSSTATIYCYHCARHHPGDEMRQIETKGGKKWRCIKSIQATRKSATQRDAFGKTVTAINKSETQMKTKARMDAERSAAGG